MAIDDIQAGRTADTQVDHQSVCVLVVDDSRTIRNSVQQLLRPHGHTVLTAGNGYTGLCVVAQQHPDIVFMDLMMPRLNGYQACALLKRHPIYGRTPVIMVSSKNGLFDRARGKMAGSEHHIQKPFSGESLLGAINTFVELVH